MKTITMHIDTELITQLDAILGGANSDVRKMLRREAGRENAGRAALIRRALRLALDHRDELLQNNT